MGKSKKTLPVLNFDVSLVDSHCHLDMDTYQEDLDTVLHNAFAHGIRSVITIGINVPSSTRAVEIAAKYPMVHATVGIHPHDTANLSTDDLDDIEALIDNKRGQIVGYGEIGLDYVKLYAPKDKQIKAFNDQLAISKKHRLPVIIHDREAHEDILTILRKHGPFDYGGIMHCFSGDMEYAKKVLDLGFHISIPGIVTFKNATDLQLVATEIPLDRMLVETDGPFLAPAPYRGKRNEPLFLLYTTEEIARLRDLHIDEIASATTANCLKLFSISLP